jgi:hypothetical protein
MGRNAGDGLDRRQERFFVGLGRLVETTDLSNELKGRSVNFLCKRMVMAACTFAEPGMTISSWWKRGGFAVAAEATQCSGAAPDCGGDFSLHAYDDVMTSSTRRGILL